MTEKIRDMDQGIVIQGFVPLRREPFEKSEMVSQVLFGETFHILEYDKDWTHIEHGFDGYRGWLNRVYFHKLTDPSGHGKEKSLVISQSTIVTRKITNQKVILPAGSVTGFIEDGLFSLNGEIFQCNNQAHFIKPDISNDIESVSRELVSIPYLWGGRCGFGFDCSGLVQFLSRLRGIDLPRDSSQQALKGENINFIHEILPGDLAFFDNAEGEIIHVGMVLSGGRIIHSSGFVKIDRLDQQGIFNVEKGKYTHRLRVIKRMENMQ